MFPLSGVSNSEVAPRFFGKSLRTPGVMTGILAGRVITPCGLEGT